MTPGRVLSATLLALPWLASLAFISDEWAVHAARRDLAIAQQADYRAAAPPLFDQNALPARAALLHSLALTQAAINVANADDKSQLLDAANRMADQADSGRPGWGEVSVARAYVAVANGQATDSATIRLFAQSYAEAPYLRGAVVWRLRYGGALWDRLDTATQAHVLDEAIWLSLLGPANYMRAHSALQGTPAQAAYYARRNKV
jgi:hypothetical protein